MQDAVGDRDDAAARALTEDRVEARDRGRAGIDEVAEHVAGADGRELVDVADEEQVGRARDRAQQGRGELGVQHRGLVDDHEVGRERVLGVGGEAAFERVELEQAVDRRGLHARGFGHALRRAAGRRAQRHAHALGPEDVAEGLEDGRLTRAGSAGEDGDFVLQRHEHAGRLGGREGEAGAGLGPFDGLVGDDGRQARRRGEEALDRGGDGLLGLLLEAELHEAHAARGEHAHGVFLHQLAQAVVDDRLVDLEELGGLLEQAFVGEGAVAFAFEFLERVQDAGVDALRAGGGQAEVARDLVRGLEADAFDFAADAVRFGGEDFLRVLAVGLDDADAEGVGHAVGLQEDHDLAQGLLVVPRGLDGLRAAGADAVDFAEAARLVGDDVEGADAEAGDDLVGVGLADALDEAAAEVFADAVDGGGQARAERAHAQLRAVRGMAFPVTADVDGLAALQASHVAEDDDFLAGLGRELRDREMRLLVEPQDALDHARKGGFGSARRFAWRRHALSQSAPRGGSETKINPVRRAPGPVRAGPRGPCPGRRGRVPRRYGCRSSRNGWRRACRCGPWRCRRANRRP